MLHLSLTDSVIQKEDLWKLIVRQECIHSHERKERILHEGKHQQYVKKLQ